MPRRTVETDMSRERGSAILMAIVVVVILTGLGIALLFLGENELGMSRGSNDERAAFHLAEAGIETARMRLLDVNGAGSFDDDLLAAAGVDGALGVDPAAIRPSFDAQGAVDGLTGVGDDVAVQPLAALDGGAYAAFLSNDPVEGIVSLNDSNRRVMLTGVGVARNGAWEVVQAIVEPTNPLPAVPMAAITMIGPPPTFDNGNSNAQSHTGQDCPLGGGIPNLYVPIVGATEAASKSEIQDDMNRPNNFVSGALTGEDTIADLTDPTDPAMAQSGLAPIDPAWTDCASVKSMVQGLIASADYYCNTDSGTCTTPVGNAGDIVVIDGDATAGSFSAGLLLVTGTLTYSGNDAWHGIVLVLGEGRLHRNGGGNGRNSGAVVIANVDPSPNGPRADKSDWCDNGFEPTSFTVNGAGSSTISYCSDDVTNNNPVGTYQVTEFLQR